MQEGNNCMQLVKMSLQFSNKENVIKERHEIKQFFFLEEYVCYLIHFIHDATD